MVNFMPKILAIDSVSDNLISMKAIIDDAFPGSIVFTALNGPKGIELAIANNPDVILLDIIMPNIDGFEVCHQLKLDERVSDIPVVFLTALKGDKANRIKALEIGAEGFLSKPIDETELTAQIRAMVKIKVANEQKKNEKERLEKLVQERTIALQNELSERKKSEKALRDSEERFRHISSSISDISYSCVTDLNKNSAINWLYGAIEKITGYTSDELFEMKCWGKLVIDEDFPIFKTRILGLLPGHSDVCQLRLKRKDGSIVWIQTTAECVKDPSGADLNILYGGLNDITERKQFETKLKESNEHLKIVLENTPIAIWDWNIKTDFWVVTPKYYTLLGYEPEYGNPDRVLWLNRIHPDDRESVREKIKNVLQLICDDYNYDARMLHADGTYRWQSVIGHVLERDENGKASRMLGVRVDITERKRAEEAFLESQSIYLSFIEQLPNAVFRKDLEGRFVLVNSQFCKIKGVPREKLLGKKPEEVGKSYLSEYGAPWQSAKYANIGERIHNLIIQKGERIELEEEYPSSDGKMEYMHVVRMPVVDSNAKIIGSQGIMFDITERKKAEAELREKEVQYRNLANSGTALIWTTGNDKQCYYFNEPWLNFTGRTLVQELGNGWTEGVHPEDLDRCIQTYITAFDKHETFDMEYRLRHFSGEYRWIEDLGKPNYDSEGEFVGYIGHCFDITDRKKLETELIQAKEKAELSEQQLLIKNKELTEKNKFIQTILDNLPIGIALNTIDEEMVTYMNKKFEEIYGCNLGEIPTVLSFFERVYPDPDYRDKLMAQVMDDIHSGDRKRMHWENLFVTRQDGSKGFANAINIPLIEQNTMVSTVSDITELHKSQTELLKAKEKAEESDRLKSAFLANMSHEVRTPLNSIVGFSDLLLDPSFDRKDYFEFAKIISESGNSLLAIISDIMDFSKIEAGQIKISKSPVDVQKLISAIQREYSFTAQRKGLALKIAPFNPEDDILITSDENRLRQVLVNLVGNAIKFTIEGSVELGVKRMEDRIQFHVKDSGIGIPKEYHLKIFERFRQVEASNSRRFGGNGLGLAISKSLVELLGGTIWVESAHGKGSIFYFAIPIKQQNDE